MATSLALRLSNLSISSTGSIFQKLSSQFHTQSSPLLFQATHQLWAEPMKKKKRVDPAVIAAREQKKIKKIDKEIKKRTRFGRILKPIEEIEVDRRKIMLARERKRNNPALSFDESERRALLHKEWSIYKTQQWRRECQISSRMMKAQEEALQELRAESEELYQAALQVDYSFVPCEFEGPKETPAIKDYKMPDGEYTDTTRKY